jgi:hypothetical protein
MVLESHFDDSDSTINQQAQQAQQAIKNQANNKKRVYF